MMPRKAAKLSLGSAGLDLASTRTPPTERQLTLMDLPRAAMVIVGASLSKGDIRALRQVSRGVCSLATACMKAITLYLRACDNVDTVERAVERFKGVPRLFVDVYGEQAHLLWAGGLLPTMQGLRLFLQGSTAGERDEVVRMLQGATRLRTAVFTSTDINEGLRLVVNCLALERLTLYPFTITTSHDAFWQLSRLSNLQSLSILDGGKAGDLSSITCLTSLTQLRINVGPEVSLRPLAHLPRLISLAVRSHWGGTLPEDFVLSCLAAECRGNLKSLKLRSFGNATAEAVRHLALCTSLVCLDIHADTLPLLAEVEPMLKGLPHLETCRWSYVDWRPC